MFMLSVRIYMYNYSTRKLETAISGVSGFYNQANAISQIDLQN